MRIAESDSLGAALLPISLAACLALQTGCQPQQPNQEGLTKTESQGAHVPTPKLVAAQSTQDVPTNLLSIRELPVDPVIRTSFGVMLLKNLPVRETLRTNPVRRAIEIPSAATNQAPLPIDEIRAIQKLIAPFTNFVPSRAGGCLFRFASFDAVVVPGTIDRVPSAANLVRGSDGRWTLLELSNL